MTQSTYRGGAILFLAFSFLAAFFISFSLLINDLETQSEIKGVPYDKQPGLNTWFEADTTHVHEAFTNSKTFWHKTNRHPLFPYVSLLPVKVMGLLGVPEEFAVCFTLAVGVGLFSCLFALTLVLTLGHRPLCWFMQALFFASSFFIFWAGICERFPMGGATIMATAAGAAYLSRKEKPSLPLAVFLNVVSLSVTISNWMFGVLLSLCFFPLRKVIRITGYSVVITAILWLGEGLFIEQLESPTHFDSWNKEFIFTDYAGSVFQKTSALLGHTVVMPEIHPYNFAGFQNMDGKGLGVQHSSPGGTGPLGFSLAVGWALLLITGALSWWRNTEKTPFDRFLSFSILGQLGIHFVYGTELFLYGPHVAPLLLLVTARGLGALERPKLKLALLALGLFVPLLALHNLARYTQARLLFLHHYEGKKEAVSPEATTKPHALSPEIPLRPSA